MEFKNIHSWELCSREAFALQEKLKGKVRESSLRKKVGIIAGADVAFSRKKRLLFGAVVVMSCSDFTILETATSAVKESFPYIPGLLSFREAPALLEAFGRLAEKPDLIFFDGQGKAHPRRLGLASHMGLFLNTPSIGCAKSRLIGTFEDPPFERGGCSALLDKGATIGAVVRTRTGVQPVYVSIGHLIDLPSAVSRTLSSCTKYRLPEPIRAAHHLVTTIRADTEREGHCS